MSVIRRPYKKQLMGAVACLCLFFFSADGSTFAGESNSFHWPGNDRVVYWRGEVNYTWNAHVEFKHRGSGFRCPGEHFASNQVSLRQEMLLAETGPGSSFGEKGYAGVSFLMMQRGVLKLHWRASADEFEFQPNTIDWTGTFSLDRYGEHLRPYSPQMANTLGPVFGPQVGQIWYPDASLFGGARKNDDLPFFSVAFPWNLPTGQPLEDFIEPDVPRYTEIDKSICGQERNFVRKGILPRIPLVRIGRKANDQRPQVYHQDEHRQHLSVDGRRIEGELEFPIEGAEGPYMFWDPVPMRHPSLWKATARNNSVKVRWKLERLPDRPMELIVERPVEYDTWRPEGAEDESTAGNEITFRARLQAVDGGVPPQVAKWIQFRLIDTSTEPGVCLNWPTKAQANRVLPDLRIDVDRNRQLEVLDLKGQRARTWARGVNEASVVVSAYDWGGYANLEVTAAMADGSQLVGHLDGSWPETTILLPKRETGSMVADVWKQKRGAAGLDDKDDAEQAPEGDGHPGDGLSLYEEYRGFRVDGRHVHGDPLRKDCFVYSSIRNRRVDDGVTLFEDVTGLAVRRFLQEDEIYEKSSPSGRIQQPWLNFNSRTAHLVDQRYIPLEKDRLPRFIGGWYDPVDETITMTSRGVPDNYDQTTVVHELLHAVGVEHHGSARESGRNVEDIGSVRWQAVKQEDEWQIIETRLDPDTSEPVGTGTPITVRYEDNRPVKPKRIGKAGVALWVAVQGGQHSGDQECLTRYDNANAVTSSASSPVRYVIRWPGEPLDEKPGRGLCSSPKGTGINDPGRAPRPRYGDAWRGGDCQHQIRISDR